VLAHLSHHLVTALPGPLLPYIRDEFALDYTRAGFIMSAFGVVYGICQLPGGWLADRFGPRILLTVGIVGVSITGLLVGMSPNYLVLLAGLVLMGILGGGYHPAATSYFLAPLIAAGVAGAWGWRSPFIVLAILGIGFGIFLHVVLKKRVPLQKAATPGTSVSTEAPPAPGNLRRVITLIAMSSFTQAMVIAIISFIPLFLVDTYNTSKETAAASISLIYFMGLWAAPFGGYLSDRFGRITIIIAMGVMASIMVYLLNVVPYGFGIGAVLVFTGIALYFNTTVAQAYIVDETPIKRRSTMLGFYFFANMEGAGILTPVLGYLIDHFSFYTSFAFSSAAIVAVLIVCSTLLWLGRR